MLLKMRRDARRESLDDLCWHASHDLLLPYRNLYPKRTVTLGRISHPDKRIVAENLAALARKSKELSEEGWIVLDLVSFQPSIDRIVKRMNIIGYPYEILERFTKPLIREGWFSAIHFRFPIRGSIGTEIEWDEAIRYKVKIISFE